jgi:hypothetical protein
MRRSLGAVLWTLVGILACFLGGLAALVSTDAGRHLMTRVAQGALERVVAGRVEIGGVSGTLLTGLDLRDVRLYDLDTTLVAWLPRAEVDYNLLDFAAGRIVLQRVRLEHPYVNIVQHKSGRLNLEELLKLGGPSGPAGGAKPLVVLRNVSLADGDVVLRLQSAPSPADSLYEIDAFGPDGRHRVRRFGHVTTILNAFRISAPGQRGLLLDIADLAFQGTDPDLTVTDLRGQIAIDGDSLSAELPVVRLPASRASVRGRVTWPRDTVLYDLAVRAAPVTLADARFIDRRFPDGAVARGALAIRSHGGRVLEVRFDTLDLGYRGGRVTGRTTAILAADSGLVALRQTDLTSRDLDLGLPRLFLDTLPFYGHLTGHVTADGLLSALTLDADWSFRDSLVAGRPDTRIRGRGLVDLTSPAGITFAPFTLDSATIDLATFAEFVPSPLHGTLRAAGTLSGPLTDLRFTGALRQRDGAAPASSAHGVFAVDARRDTLALDVDAQVDTLSFDGLASSFPHLPLTGAVTGTVRLAGRLDSLAARVDLARPGGRTRVRGSGALTLLPDRFGARRLSVSATDLSLDRWLRGAPPSRLNLTLSGDMDVDSGALHPRGDVALQLAASQVAGVPLDSGAAQLHIADGRIRVDTLWVRQPGLITEGAGDLGWRRPQIGETLLTLDADSVASLDSAFAWFIGAWGDSARARLTAGAATLHLRVAGALDSLAIGGLGDVQNLAVGPWRAPQLEARGDFEPGAVPLVWLDARSDSVAYGSMGFGAAHGAIRGRRDSLAWFGRSRIGDLSEVVAGGSFVRDSAGPALRVDSLALLLPGGVWFLQAPADVALGDSAFAIRGLALQQVNGPGRLEVSGRIPMVGDDSAQLHLTGFPLAGVFAMLQRDTLGVAGRVSTDITIHGSRRAPTYVGRFAVVPDTVGAPSLDGSFRYAARRLDAGATLRRNQGEIVGFTAHLPLDLALTDVPRRELPDTLAIRARARDAPLTAAAALTSALRDVHGRLNADVGIRGTWDALKLDGALQIDSGGVAIPAINVRWDDIAGRLRLGGDTIYVDSLRLRSDRGDADLSGSVRLERLSRPILALTIDARDFKALEIRGNLSVTASARLVLRGPVFGATLTGQGTVTNGLLYFADLVEKRIIDLDVPDPALAGLIDTSLAAVIRRQGLGPSFHSVFLDSLAIRDLQLTMGNNVWLRSNEANIQLGGLLTVNKRGDNYLLTGTLQAPRGTYRLLVGPVNRDFVVTQGTVRYFGTPDLDAALDIEARHVVHPLGTASASSAGTCPAGDVVVVAHLGGTLLVPRLSFSAQGCEMSQTDLISYLMFGQAAADIAQTEGGASGANRRALLVSTAASLAAGEIERSVISDFGIPLDYVEIRPGEPGNPLSGASVAVGKQLGAKTFFIVRASLCPGAVTSRLGASLQFRISPEWRTEASVEPATAGCTTVSSPASQLRQVGGDLFWERRY